MTQTTTTVLEPTRTRYQCDSNCGTITFHWTRQMPQGGWLGEVTIGQYVNKPIQVFNAQRYNGVTDWTFQAQDGTFLGHLYVSGLRSYIRFAKFRAGDKFPQVTCSIPTPEPGDSRDPIDKIV